MTSSRPPGVRFLHAAHTSEGTDNGYWSRDGLRLARQMLQFVGLAWLIDEYVMDFSQTQGPSMLPTFNEFGDVVLVDKLSPHWDPITVNDVVIAVSPNRPSRPRTLVCKRVHAVAGDTVTPVGWPEGVQVRGEAGRGAAGAGAACRAAYVQVPPGHVWLEGDNPMDSADSRMYGPVPRHMLRGRVVARVWPLTQARWIHRGEPPPTHNDVYYRAMMEDPALCGRAREVHDMLARIEAVHRQGEDTGEQDAGTASAAGTERDVAEHSREDETPRVAAQATAQAPA